MTLEEIAADVKACSRCALREGCTAPVPGIGSETAEYMILGEAPGREEDRAGIPFVGKAGQRLNKLLKLSGIDTNNCYFTNVCRCRPPKNRAPRKAESRSCRQWLEQEIKLIQPKYIITLGSTPLALFSPYGITQMHGTMFEHRFNGISSQIIAQYHPAAALHQPRLWATMLNDWENLPEAHDTSFVVDRTIAETPTLVALDTENSPQGDLGEWSIVWRAGDTLSACPFYGKEGANIIRRMNLKRTPVIMHNAKWDLRVLRNNKMPVPLNVHDTMIAAYCMGLGKQDVTSGEGDAGMVGGLGLKYLARRHLGMRMKTWKEVFDAAPEVKLEYNLSDSLATFLLWEKFLPTLPDYYYNIDMPLLHTIMAMEDRGIQVDAAFLKEFDKTLAEELSHIDLPINPFSHPQVREYVYGTLGVQPFKLTDSGAPSTDDTVLETIDDPVVERILQYRRLYKERRTYVKNYLERMTLNRRIHPEFKQTSTATSRLSSANPNLQNVPARKDATMRSLFIAKDGHTLVRLDWSQLQLRIFAAITKDPVMCDIFARGGDIHQETADLLGIDRKRAKNINFLMLFGGEAWKISNEFHIPLDEAKECIRKYRGRFRQIGEYYAQIKEQAERDHFVTMWTGRKRRLDAMYADDWRVRQKGLREAINTPIQGGEAEIVKITMNDLHYKHAAPMILQVHDELIFEIPTQDANEYAHWLKDYVPSIVELEGVRFPVSVGVGQNWFEASKEENEI